MRKQLLLVLFTLAAVTAGLHPPAIAQVRPAPPGGFQGAAWGEDPGAVFGKLATKFRFIGHLRNDKKYPAFRGEVAGHPDTLVSPYFKHDRLVTVFVQFSPKPPGSVLTTFETVRRSLAIKYGLESERQFRELGSDKYRVIVTPNWPETKEAPFIAEAVLTGTHELKYFWLFDEGEGIVLQAPVPGEDDGRAKVLLSYHAPNRYKTDL